MLSYNMNDQEKINLIIGLAIFLAIYMVWVGCGCNSQEQFFGGGSGSCPPCSPTSCPTTSCPTTTCPTTSSRGFKMYVSDYLDDSAATASYFSNIDLLNLPSKEVIDVVKNAIVNGLRLNRATVDKLTDQQILRLYLFSVYSADFIDVFSVKMANLLATQGSPPKTINSIISDFSINGKSDIVTDRTVIPAKYSTGSHDALYIPQPIFSLFTDTELFYISNSIGIKNGLLTPFISYENGRVKSAISF